MLGASGALHAPQPYWDASVAKMLGRSVAARFVTARGAKTATRASSLITLVGKAAMMPSSDETGPINANVDDSKQKSKRRYKRTWTRGHKLAQIAPRGASGMDQRQRSVCEGTTSMSLGAQVVSS